MADVVCGGCALFSAGAGRCRVTNAVTAAGASCALTPAQRLALLRQSRAIVAGFRDASGRTRVMITGLSRCSGGGHLVVTGTVNGTERALTIDPGRLRELRDVAPADQLLTSLMEFCALCDVQTMAEAETALAGQVFYIG